MENWNRQRHMEPDDSTLIQRTRQGDMTAFELLVRRYQNLVAGTAYGWLGDAELARDVAQEVFLEAHLKLDQLENPAAFRGWLRRIVIKQCDRITRRRQVPLLAEEMAEPTATAPGPSSTAERAEAADQIRFAVEGLPRQEREVIALHYFAEATGPELADYLELPLSTVKKRLRSARERLKTQGERLMEETMQRMKPSQGADLSAEVRFFLALRAGDRTEVAQLIAADPELANARQQWAPDLVLQGLLPFASDATALITAVELDDIEMLKLLLEAGADVDGRCGCATAESPLWAATLFNRVTHVRSLLEAGADPNQASASGNYPLHLAAMRGLDEVAGLLLEHGADVERKDEGPRYPRPFSPRGSDAHAGSARTAAEWAQENGHAEIARQLAPASQQPADSGRGGIVALEDGLLHTGVKAMDLLAPVVRGQIIRVPFKAGVGMVVLLGELCSRFCRSAEGAAVWTGFAQPPFDLQDWQAEMAEFGLKDRVSQYLASFQDTSAARRAAFADGVQAALAQAEAGLEVLMVVQATEGFQGDIDAALLRLSAAETSGSVTTMVITNFPESKQDVWAELTPPYSGQLVLDRLRARAHLFPAIAPDTTLSAANGLLSETHRLLAEKARRLLADYQAEDPEFANLPQRTDEPAVRLLHYLCQPFQVTEPFTGRPGEWVARQALLTEVAAILGDQ